MSPPAELGDDRWHRLLHDRATAPELIAKRLADRRRRRPLLGPDGRLFLVAADHTARGMTGVGDRPFAMASRRDLLARLLVALGTPGVDGLLASPDIVEDLVLLDGLHERVVVGTMNRGGLMGSAWELDDHMTAYDPQSIDRAELDGGKMLLRIDRRDPATLPTIEACARAVTDLAARDLMAMVEPLPYTTTDDGRAVLDPDPDELVRAVGVASGLGSTSARTWLKLPATPDVERVMAATSLPALILGGAPGDDPDREFAAWRRALQVPNVRGLVVGRSLLYPADDDVAAAVATAAAIVRPEEEP